MSVFGLSFVRVGCAFLLVAVAIIGIGCVYGIFGFGYASYISSALLILGAGGVTSVVLRLARIQQARLALGIGIMIAVSMLLVGYGTFWHAYRTVFELDVDVAYKARLKESPRANVTRDAVRRDILAERFGGREPGFWMFLTEYTRTTTIHWTRRGRYGFHREGDRAGGWIWVAWFVQAVMFLVLVPYGALHGAERARHAAAYSQILAAVPSAKQKRWISDDPGEILIERYGAEPRQLLFHAIRIGNRRAFDAALAAGAMVDQPFDDGTPPLVAAAHYGNSSVEWLLDAGGEMDVSNQDGDHPLHVACRHAHEATVRTLLARGADPNSRDNRGSTPLMQAASQSTAATLIPVLLRHGADPNAKNHDGENALMAAAFAGREEAVELLVNVGAEVESTDNRGWTPLAHAAARNLVAIMQCLMKHGANMNRTFANDESPSSVAASRHQPEALDLLLRLGTDPHHRVRGVSMLEQLEWDLGDRPNHDTERCLALLRRYIQARRVVSQA